MTDDWDLLTHCECGQPLDTHDPLPKPKPLTSWKAGRSRDEAALQKMIATKNRNPAWNRAWKNPIKVATASG